MSQSLPFPFKGAIYGASNTGKSSQIAELITDYFKRTGRKTRVFNFDDGGVSAYAPLVQAGLVDLVDIYSPPPTLKDPQQWYRLSPIVWWEHIVRGDWVRVVNGVLQRVPAADRLNDDYGMLVIEGADAFGKKAGGSFIESNKKVGQEVVASFTEEGIGGVVFNEGSLAMAHYKALQNVIEAGMPRLWNRQYDIVLLTTHEAMGEDKMGMDGKMYGPALFGKALTPKAAEAIPFLGHTELVLKPSKDAAGGYVREFRVYLQPHQDPSSMDPRHRWPANSRVHLSVFGEHEKAYPGGYKVMTPTDGLAQYVWHWMDLTQLAMSKLTGPSLNSPKVDAPAPAPAAQAPSPRPGLNLVVKPQQS